MFRSKAHFLMLCNLKYLELQTVLLKRFQIFKNEEIRILKKENMKTILYEWAKELTKQNNKSINITEIPSEVFKNKKISDILKADVECSWLVDKIVLKKEKEIKEIKETNEQKEQIEQNKNVKESIPFTEQELKKQDNLFFDEYPNLFYYEYPQYPYNYYEKKKMTNFYSLLKFPYNDILNISKYIKKENIKEGSEKQIDTNQNIHMDVDMNMNMNTFEGKTTKLTNTSTEHTTSTVSTVSENNTSSKENISEEDIVVNTDFVNFSSESFIYTPSEMETSKEKHF